MDEIKRLEITEDQTDLPDLTDIYNLAYKVIEHLPIKFQSLTKNLLVCVENFADEQTLQSLNINEKYDLLGLYRGVPLPLKSMHDTLVMPDIIFLYRGPLIRFAKENRETISKLVYHVMIHEIGHHFGYSDQDINWIEQFET